MNLKSLNALVTERHREFATLAHHVSPSIFGQVSDFWKKLLEDRQNFLNASDFCFFRNPKTYATYGIGTSKHTAEEQDLVFSANIEMADLSRMPDEFVRHFAEPLLGSPETILYRGNLVSTIFLQKIQTAWNIKKHCEARGLLSKPLRICEIGGGFGATALAVHQSMEVENYTLIDLPENLFLTSVFLPLSLPDRSHSLVNPERPQSFKCESDINFCLANHVGLLANQEFDLVINTASFGEMPLETSRAYIYWCRNRLSANGIIYSTNRHNVDGASGAKRLSDYTFQATEILGLQPFPRPTWPINQIGYTTVVGKAKSGNQISESILDAIGDMMMCGFDEEIAELKDRALEGHLDHRSENYLDLINQFFSVGSLESKLARIDHIASEFGDDQATGAIRLVLAAIAGLTVENSLLNTIIFSQPLGLKNESRLRGFFAENAKARGADDWECLLQPLEPRSPNLFKMSKYLIENRENCFRFMFKRDLKLRA